MLTAQASPSNPSLPSRSPSPSRSSISNNNLSRSSTTSRHLPKQDEDEDDIEELLLCAQMHLIRHDRASAVELLEKGVKSSSAACASLANLLIRSTTPLAPMHLLSISPPPFSSSSRPFSRPHPSRQHSHTFAHASASSSKNASALRAAELCVMGCEIELAKPVRGAEALESGYASAAVSLAGGGERGVDDVEDEEDDEEEEEEGAEGKHFNLERVLDLVVGITDRHRFGDLTAPFSSQQPEEDHRNDDLWRRSAIVATVLLHHPLIRPIVDTITSLPPCETALSSTRSVDKRRQSVSRSYKDAVCSIPDIPVFPTGLVAAASSLSALPALTPTVKLQLTIAIHSLYILALQAHSSPATHMSSPERTASHAEAEMYWTTITRLAAPYAPLGGIGVREGDELVSRARHRLETLRRLDLGPDEPWRLAKGKKASTVTSTMALPSFPRGSIWEGTPASEALTIRATPMGSIATLTSSFGGKTPRAGGAKSNFGMGRKDAELNEDDEDDDGHEDVERGEEPLQFSNVGDSPATRSIPLPSLPPLFSSSSSPSTNLTPPSANAFSAARQQYPSPPETPPIEEGPQLYQLPPRRRPSFLRASTLSPSSAANPPLPFLQHPYPSAYSTPLHRAPSIYSFTSHRTSGGASVLSSFSVNPLERYCRSRLSRGTTATGLSTAPPDLSAVRTSRKGKGRAVELVHEPTATLLPLPPATTKSIRTWLSRVRASTKEGFGVEDREKSATVVEVLQRTLKRHDAAEEGALMFWSEDEFVEEEEVAVEEVLEEEEAAPEAGSSTVVDSTILATASLLRPSAPSCHHPRSVSQDTIRPRRSDAANSTPLHPPRSPARPRGVKPQRSFLLNDPTSAPSSATSSPASSRSSSPARTSPSPSQRRPRRSHSRNPSAASSVSFTIDGHLAASNCLPPPSPQPRDVGIDPLLLALERNSQLGKQSTCALCGKGGTDLPQCRSCEGRYCSRSCRVSEGHGCSAERRERKARAAAVAL